MHKKTSQLILILLAFAMCLGCGELAEPAATQAAVAVTPVPTVAVVEAAIAVATPSPVPTPTPTPTPEPTPEPRPASYLGDAERSALMMDVTNMRLVAMAGKSVKLYESLDEDAKAVWLTNENTDPARSELIVLGEETAANGTPYYRVRAAFSDATGYVAVSSTGKSVLAEEQISGYGITARPGCLVFRSWSDQSKIVSREGYHAVRVLGSYKGYYYVVTQNGVWGYVDAAQVQMLDRDRIEQFLAYAQVPDTAESFSLVAFTDAMESRAGEQAESTEELIVSQLTYEGLFFSPGYYRFFRKRFTDDSLYPQGFYLDDVYNSLLFKLWNSAGDLVTCNGQETQWLFLDDYTQVQRGDILFFTEYDDPDDAVIKNYEVVFRGPYSGHVTACGVYLGDDRMLTVNNGTVEIVENLSAGALFPYFDSARRILSEVMDEKAYLIERMISAIYDRLGTPYDNFDRLGDRSYDCSGIMCWALRSMGVTRNYRRPDEQMEPTTASGFSTIKRLYLDDKVINLGLINSKPQHREDIEKLERGDLVFLLNSSKSRISHIMMYIGDGRVIHSTTVTSKYTGTLVAQFRSELQGLYYHALRIHDIVPRQK